MSKVVTIRIITVLFLASLPFLGSDCEDVINQINNPATGTLQGNWTLIYNAGTTLDICPGEMVSFPSNTGGTADLQCPENSNVIQRDYSVSGTTLTYTSSNVQYAVSFTQNNELVLTGINNNRLLYYTTTISSKKTNEGSVKSDSKASNYNSSEIIK
ncbi:MAG: hypothetical protein ABI543_05900 [Ignavibacteria bacterium]